MADRLPVPRAPAGGAGRGRARADLAARALRHRLPPPHRSVHVADRRQRHLSLLDDRNVTRDRRTARDDPPVPVAAAAALSADRQPALQHRRQGSPDGVLLGAQAPGSPRARDPAWVRRSRLSLLRALHPRGERRQSTHARVLRGALRPRGLGALAVALASILAAVVGPDARDCGRRGLCRPRRAASGPPGRRADRVRVHLQHGSRRRGPVSGDHGHRPSGPLEALRGHGAARGAARRPASAVPAARGELRRVQLAGLARFGRRLRRRPARGRRRDVEVRGRPEPSRAGHGLGVFEIRPRRALAAGRCLRDRSPRGCRRPPEPARGGEGRGGTRARHLHDAVRA